MRIPRLLRDPVVQAAAMVGGAWSVFAWLTWRAPSNGRPSASSGGWTRLEGSEVLAEGGKSYRAAIDVPWYVPDAVLSDAKIRAVAADRGFRVTWIGRDAPSWSSDGDLWIEAEATRTIAFDRPSALVGAWVRSSS